MKKITQTEWICKNPDCICLDEKMHDLPDDNDVNCHQCHQPYEIIHEVSAHYQFWTEEHNGSFPIDHFFYGATSDHYTHFDDLPDGQKHSAFHLEARGGFGNLSVSVIQGEGDEATAEEFPDYPSALRRMADLIEQFEKDNK